MAEKMSPTAQASGRFVPSLHVTDALTSLLLRGAPISRSTVLLDLAVVSAYSIARLLIGIVLFGRHGKA